jgi:multidrug efflux pump subunit AcrA (membrane-fusion protein)
MKNPVIFILIQIAIMVLACNRSNQDSEEKKPEPLVPVTIAQATVGDLADYVVLNATSSFQMKTDIKSTTSGYLQEVNIKPNDYVTKGQKLFTIRSKEAEYLGNTVNQIDTSFRFTGVNQINSPVSGYIAQITFIAGNYVQEGEILASVCDITSLVFLLDLPFELNQSLSENKTVTIILPGGREIEGTISSSLPTIDPVSQTQSCIVKVTDSRTIPENLIVKVNFIKNRKHQALSVPKEAVLTDEVQSEFWIMKMIDSHTAIKVPILKGIETKNWVEIISPTLKTSDSILLSGNYGLPDTAKVVISAQEK